MKSFHRYAVGLVAAACLQLCPAPGLSQAARLQIRYTITPQPPAGAQPAVTRVSVSVAGLQAGNPVQFQMPVWSPGDYRVTNQARFVQEATGANADGKSLAVQHPDPNTWAVTAQGSGLLFSYTLPNEPAGLFSRDVQVTNQYAFYNGPSAFVYVVGHKRNPVALHVVTPAGWAGPTSALDSADSESDTYVAADYDTMADAPLLVGKCAKREFAAVGRPHTLAFFGSDAQVDYNAYVPVIKKLVTEENRLMGGPPYKRYIFFFEVDGPGGGLEHLAGTRIGLPSRARPEQMAGEIAHEFFHLWNVKRLRPVALGPFDYIHPPHTANLWFSEGITSYYGNLTLCRSGLVTPQEYEAGLARLIAYYKTMPARHTVTADKSSYNVWEASNSSGYGGLSYYIKGELIGLCLDLKLRQVTHNMVSLDTVMRNMFAEYGLPKPGFPEDGIRNAVIAAGGPEMGPFYDLLARSTNPVPFDLCLSYAGLKAGAEPGRGPTIEVDQNAGQEALAIRTDWIEKQGPISSNTARGNRKAL